MLSPVRPSVRLSVRRVDHRKTVKVRIMKFSPYGIPIPLAVSYTHLTLPTNREV